MRWNGRYGLKGRLGEQRTRRRFMWWPTRFGTGAVRWLEWANVIEEVVEQDVGGWMQWGNYATYRTRLTRPGGPPAFLTVQAYSWVGVGFADEGVPVSESLNVVPPNVGTAVRRPVPPPPPDPPPIRVIKEGQSRPRGDEG